MRSAIDGRSTMALGMLQPYTARSYPQCVANRRWPILNLEKWPVICYIAALKLLPNAAFSRVGRWIGVDFKAGY